MHVLKLLICNWYVTTYFLQESIARSMWDFLKSILVLLLWAGLLNLILETWLWFLWLKYLYYALFHSLMVFLVQYFVSCWFDVWCWLTMYGFFLVVIYKLTFIFWSVITVIRVWPLFSAQVLDGWHRPKLERAWAEFLTKKLAVSP